MVTEAREVATEQPHVVVIEKAAGPCAVVKGTRTAVWLIVRQLRAGDSPEDIVASLPHLSLAGVYGALSYYHDHKSDIDPIIEELDSLAAQDDELEIGP